MRPLWPHDADLLTCDRHFENPPAVRFVPKSGGWGARLTLPDRVPGASLAPCDATRWRAGLAKPPFPERFGVAGLVSGSQDG